MTGERERPAVLDERDWDKIKSSKCHFARKFDLRRSAKLLDMIDREILGVSKANSVGAFATETYEPAYAGGTPLQIGMHLGTRLRRHIIWEALARPVWMNRSWCLTLRKQPDEI